MNGNLTPIKPARFLSAVLVLQDYQEQEIMAIFFNYTKQNLADEEFQGFSCRVIYLVSFCLTLFKECSSQRSKLQFGKPE